MWKCPGEFPGINRLLLLCWYIKIGQCFLFFVISKWIFQVLFHPEVPGGGCAPIDSLLGRDLSGFTQQESTLFLGKRLGILAGKKSLGFQAMQQPVAAFKDNVDSVYSPVLTKLKAAVLFGLDLVALTIHVPGYELKTLQLADSTFAVPPTQGGAIGGWLNAVDFDMMCKKKHTETGGSTCTCKEIKYIIYIHTYGHICICIHGENMLSRNVYLSICRHTHTHIQITCLDHISFVASSFRAEFQCPAHDDTAIERKQALNHASN